MEMETAVRLRLDLVVLVLEDKAHGRIRWKQATDGFAALCLITLF